MLHKEGDIFKELTASKKAYSSDLRKLLVKCLTTQEFEIELFGVLVDELQAVREGGDV